VLTLHPRLFWLFPESIKSTAFICFETDPLPGEKGKELSNRSHARHKRRKGKRINRHWHIDYLKYGLYKKNGEGMRRKPICRQQGFAAFLVRKRSYLASGAR